MSQQPDTELATIRQIVARHARRAQLADDAPLISAGLIDSMSIVDLVLDLEAALQVRIPSSAVQPTDFDSVAAIARTVARFR